MPNTKDPNRKTITFKPSTHDWITKWAEERGITFNAAVNVLLFEAKENIEDQKNPGGPDYKRRESAG